MAKRKECLYMIVTQDKYELPLFVGTCQEVAEKAHTKTCVIYSSLCHFERGRLKTCKYRRVYI